MGIICLNTCRCRIIAMLETKSIIALQTFSVKSLPSILIIYMKTKFPYTIKEGSRVDHLVQTSFADFGKGMLLISVLPYVNTEHISRIAS